MSSTPQRMTQPLSSMSAAIAPVKENFDEVKDEREDGISRIIWRSDNLALRSNKAPLVIGAVWLLQRVQASKNTEELFTLLGLESEFSSRDLRQSRTAAESFSGQRPAAIWLPAVQPQLEPDFPAQDDREHRPQSSKITFNLEGCNSSDSIGIPP
ncbi:predicted protein [Histoplasma mississippiense (nom. inval.)]|uniref:predicted protein n=1 Tax=Ajellomyces capsulatus (strain NAm1 / WU24) TaxID=2059318 RepID=UPI000157C136|nr:predicted protein [Histoplasma mississippiense (nom. inval.)]EDN07558.1 predicted protein [Histoplasma mississippiense (nom. inval.)]